MGALIYSRLNRLSDCEIQSYINTLPDCLQKDVNRYLFVNDKKARLLSRLMLLNALSNTNSEDLIQFWDRDVFDKPFINGWDSFNISHSGDYVVFCHDTSLIGVDIEIMQDIDIQSLLSFLHPEERVFIEESKNTKFAFYNIWVKKEAFLKAVGIGITKGLHLHNCCGDFVYFNGITWNFFKYSIDQNYLCYTCRPNKNSSDHLEIICF
jgi:4'-phosphopantetheinyl transferase